MKVHTTPWFRWNLGREGLAALYDGPDGYSFHGIASANRRTYSAAILDEKTKAIVAESGSQPNAVLAVDAVLAQLRERVA